MADASCPLMPCIVRPCLRVICCQPVTVGLAVPAVAAPQLNFNMPQDVTHDHCDPCCRHQKPANVHALQRQVLNCRRYMATRTCLLLESSGTCITGLHTDNKACLAQSHTSYRHCLPLHKPWLNCSLCAPTSAVACAGSMCYRVLSGAGAWWHPYGWIAAAAGPPALLQHYFAPLPQAAASI